MALNSSLIKRFFALIHEIGGAALATIYPAVCIVCDEGVAKLTHILCPSCAKQLLPLNGSLYRCKKCASMIIEGEKECHLCQRHVWYFDRYFVAVRQSEISWALFHALSFSKAERVIELMAQVIMSQLEYDYDAIAFLPKVKGSQRLAKEVSQRLKVPLLTYGKKIRTQSRFLIVAPFLESQYLANDRAEHIQRLIPKRVDVFSFLGLST